MTTTTSYSNAGRVLAVYKMDLKKLKNTGILFTILFFLFFSMSYMLTLNDAFSYYSAYRIQEAAINIYTPVSLGTAVPIFVLMPIIIASNLFDYIQSKRAVDVYHALPATRTQFMTGHILAGTTVMGGALLINYAIIMLTQLFILGRIDNFGRMFTDFLLLVFTAFVIFITTIAVAVSVGRKGDVGMFTVGVYAFPLILVSVVMGLVSEFYYGFQANWESLVKINPLPLIVLKNGLFYMQQSELSASDMQSFTEIKDIFTSSLILWVILAIAITAIAFVVYNRRKSETAETFNSNSVLVLFTKFSVSFLSSLMMGFIFYAVFGERYSYANGYEKNYFYLYFGAVIGAIISYVIVEVVLARSFKTLKKTLIPCGICIVLCLTFIASLTNPNSLGFVTKVPEASAVSNVRLNYKGYHLEQSSYSYDYSGYIFDEFGRGTVILSSPEAIDLVTKIHKDIAQTYVNIENGKTYSSEMYDASFSLNMEYSRKIGGNVKRGYRYFNFSNIENFINLEYNEEYLTQSNPIFFAEPKNVKGVKLYTLDNGVLGNEKVMPLDRAKITELMDAVKLDLAARNAENIKDIEGEKAEAILKFEFSGVAQNGYTYESYELLVEPDFVNTIKFLELGAYGEGTQSESKVVTVAIDQYYYRSYYRDSFMKTISLNDYEYNYSASYGTGYYTTDPAEMQAIIDASTTNATFVEDLAYVYLYDADNIIIGHLFIDTTKAPDFIDDLYQDWSINDYGGYYYEDYTDPYYSGEALDDSEPII